MSPLRAAFRPSRQLPSRPRAGLLQALGLTLGLGLMLIALVVFVPRVQAAPNLQDGGPTNAECLGCHSQDNMTLDAGGAQAEVKGAGVSVNGAGNVDIKGTGTVDIKGGLIKLN